MAFKTTSLNRNISKDGRRELTIKEFKRWLMRFDTDKDGRISKSELKQIVKATGGWFCRISKSKLRQIVKAAGGWFSDRKDRAGMKVADTDGNGFFDECEVENLIQFAHKELGANLKFDTLDKYLKATTKAEPNTHGPIRPIKIFKFI